MFKKGIIYKFNLFILALIFSGQTLQAGPDGKTPTDVVDLMRAMHVSVNSLVQTPPTGTPADPVEPVPEPASAINPVVVPAPAVKPVVAPKPIVSPVVAAAPVVAPVVAPPVTEPVVAPVIQVPSPEQNVSSPSQGPAGSKKLGKLICVAAAAALVIGGIHLESKYPTLESKGIQKIESPWYMAKNWYADRQAKAAFEKANLEAKARADQLFKSASNSYASGDLSSVKQSLADSKQSDVLKKLASEKRMAAFLRIMGDDHASLSDRFGSYVEYESYDRPEPTQVQNETFQRLFKVIVESPDTVSYKFDNGRLMYASKLDLIKHWLLIKSENSRRIPFVADSNNPARDRANKYFDPFQSFTTVTSRTNDLLERADNSDLDFSKVNDELVKRIKGQGFVDQFKTANNPWIFIERHELASLVLAKDARALVELRSIAKIVNDNRIATGPKKPVYYTVFVSDLNEALQKLDPSLPSDSVQNSFANTNPK